MNNYPQTFVRPADETSPDYSSTLFPRYAGLEESISIVRESHRSLGMISVGCSIGADVDSGLAIAHNLGFKEITATGFDKNSASLDIAAKGEYKTILRRPPLFRHFQERALDRAGFDTSPAIHGLDISAAPLRDLANEVTFIPTDITRASLEPGIANFVMCHNVLCCVASDTPEVFYDVVDTLANTVRPGGVLSLAVHPSKLKDYHKKPTGYAAIHARVAEVLSEQNMEPVVFGPHKAPIAFRRSA